MNNEYSSRETNNRSEQLLRDVSFDRLNFLRLFFLRGYEPYGGTETWRRGKERGKDRGTERNSTSAGRSYSLKSGDSFGRLRRWYLLGSIHKVAMATGQPGLSTLDGRSLESQSAQRMGECTRGCGTDGWLSERTREERTVGLDILSSRTGAVRLLCLYPERECIRSALRSFYTQFPILTQYLHIWTISISAQTIYSWILPTELSTQLLFSSFVDFFSLVVISRSIFCLRSQQIYIFQ